MSVFDIGINDVSDQDRAIKDKLASKDGHIAALTTQLSRQNEQMKELKEAFNENLRKNQLMWTKLAGQTTRVVELENNLKAQATSLSNEKMASQNAGASLAAANATIKQREFDARELEVKLDQLSRLSDEHKSRADKLAKDKTSLEARVRELNATFHQSTSALPPTTPGRPRIARSRSRSSSPSRGKIIALERELNDLRAIVQQKEADAELANEKASRAQDEQIRVGNEKTALERRMARELGELKATLDEKEDEMRGYAMASEDFSRREKELEDRIDEDEDRHQRLVRDLERELTTAKKEAEKQKSAASNAEARQIELVAEREQALEKLDIAHRQSTSTETTPHADNETTQHIERLLAATERLRSERDALEVERKTLLERLEFSQMESKFSLEALNAELAAALTGTEDVTTLRTEHSTRYRDSLTQKDAEIRRLGIAFGASALIIQHLDSSAAQLTSLALNASSSYTEAQAQLTKAHSEHSELNHKLQQAEFNSVLNVEYLKEHSRENDELRGQLEAKDAELEHASTEVKAAEEAQEFYRKLYDDAESQRSSLALEVTNLTNELSTAKEDLKAAESRYTALQFHQFDSMSKTDGMRMLQNELVEERARVERRDNHMRLLQNDIGRMETTMALQDERLNEMTSELEAMAAAKDAMVDDCADARDARDSALSRLEEMEVVMETRAEERDRAVEGLVKVVVRTVGSARERLRVERVQATHAKQALASLEKEHRMALEMAQGARAHSGATEEVAEEARQTMIALAVSQIGLSRAFKSIQEITLETDALQHEVMAQRDDMDQDAMVSESLTQQLEAIQVQATAAALDFSTRTSELEQYIQTLQQTISDNQARHNPSVEELDHSKEQLSATLQATKRSLAESSSDEDINCLREQYTTQLAEARAQISESERVLAQLRTCHAATEDELQKALEDAKNAREELDTGVAQSLRDAASHQERQEEILLLRDELAIAQSKQEAAEIALEDSKSSLDRLETELDSLKEIHKGSLAQITQEHAAVRQELEGKVAELQSQLDDRTHDLDIATQESERLSRRLEAEVSSRNADKEHHQKRLEAANSQRKEAETALAQLQEEIESTRVELQHSAVELGHLQQEKITLQQEITTLEAEVQKSISLKRYLESQVKESEGKVTAHVVELEQVRADLARSEKACNAAEVNLSLQGAQHKRETSDLNRQLAALRSQPNLQSALAELEERNDEMEELLKKKCVEIEENDDRALEANLWDVRMLKENKKLTTKVESLTRKVQTLQTKLAAAKASIPVPLEAPQAITPPQPPVQSSSSGSRIADRARSVTVTGVLSSSEVPPVPPLPAFLSSAPSNAQSPASRTPLHRAVSGPSSLVRPKTPERTVAPHPPVFKARTPEPRMTSSSPPESSSSSSIGKKRRAPDDFEACEGLPPQGFTVDSLPSQEHNNHITATTATPRTRRMLSGLQSGFTPVRNNARPIVSPKRLMTMKGSRSSPVIADVTNSPRGQSSKTKRSWLGKIRGASSQATSNQTDTRARLKREAS
ncbi:hypothetical protein DXG01_009720 [Tephrocybe rancida]|nr:hypothetical protein DXG01_009720 [Tephrocybe rancida]